MLKIAEKRIVEHAYEISEKASLQFPDVNHPEELDAFLSTHPEIIHAFLWTGKGSLDFRSQPGRMPILHSRRNTKRSQPTSDICLTCGRVSKSTKVKKNAFIGRTARLHQFRVGTQG